MLLSTLTVNTLNDAVANDGVLSLREAISMSASGDTVTFAPSLAGWTIVLGGTQLQILNKNLTITGLGADQLAVSGNNASRVFDIESSTVSFSGLTIANGLMDYPGRGGGIYNSSDSLTLTDCTLSGNIARGGGGGIYSNSGTLTLSGCTFTSNSASAVDATNGGGIYNSGTATLTSCTFSHNGALSGGGIASTGTTLTLTNCTFDHNGGTNGGGMTNAGALVATGCTFSNNSAEWAGGVLNYGIATLDKCTVIGNSAMDGNTGGIRNTGTLIVTNSTINDNGAIESGGGVDNYGTATLINCTLTGNHDANGMGAAAIKNNGNLTLNNCTVSGNTSNGGGGIRNGATATLFLYNTIVSGNSANAGPSDIVGTADPSSSHNLIGVGGGLTNGINGNIVGVTDPKLRALVDNGGPTLTMSLLLDSPALNAGDNSLIPSGILYDQRGAGYPRIHDGTVDIGAYETQTFVNHAPVVSVVLGSHSPYSGQVLTATARPSDSDGDAVTLTYVWKVNGSVVQTTGNTTALTDTFNLALAGHGDAGDTITVAVTPTDSLGLVGTPASDSAHVVSAGLVVTTLQDVTNPTDGLTSLREAIDSANSGQTVTFASALAGGTIVLNGTQLRILNKSLSINGLGADRLAVSGNPDPAKYSRLFYVTGGQLAIDGLTITSGHVGDSGAFVYDSGGAIYSNSSTVSINNSTVSGNSANLFGGAIYSDNSSTLTITNSTLSGNSGSENGGGAICSDNSSTLTITNSTLSGNSTKNNGGAILSVRDSTLTVTSSTLSGNSAAYYGGAISSASSTLFAYNSIFSGNTVKGVAADIDGTLAPSSSHNLIGIGGGLTNGVNGNIVGVTNPKLGPLTNNGGPTQTMALLPGSPALNAGDNSLIPAGIIYDQRGPGYPRIVNGTVNIGAYEADQSSASTTQVSLAGAFNRTGIYANGKTFSSSGGLDLSGYALSATLLGSSPNWDNIPFTIGPANTSNIVHGGSGVVINLPTGQDASLRLLATAVNGNQPNQTFTVRYTDGTTSTFAQGISDWHTPQNYSGESTAVTMPYRNTSSGGQDNRTFYLYGYNFALNPAKTVQNLTLPNNTNVEVAAITLIASGPVVTPAAPTNLTAQAASSTQINLSWNASIGATSYNLYRSATSGGEGSTAYRTGITGTSFSDTALSPTTTYFYKVAAVNSAGTSPQSTEASATTLASTGTTTTPVPLSGSFNQVGIQNNGATFTSSASLDGSGYALSATLLGSSISWNGNSFLIGPAGANDVVRGGSAVTVNLPAGQFQNLQFLATAVNGNQPGQSFTVRYADGTTTTFTQSISDWATPQSYSGESTALTMAYRNTSSGGQDNRTFRLYGYSLSLDQGKTLQSLTLPNNANVKLLAVTLVGASGPVVTPPAPTNLMAQATSSSQINLSWNASTGATNYNIYRSAAPGGEGTTPYRTGITGTTFSDISLSPSTPYFYKVAAVNSAGASPQSSEASATTLPASTSTTTQVSLAGAFNRTGIYANGATFSSSGGLDLSGYALSSALLGSSLTWNTVPFAIGPAGANDVIHGGPGVTVNLPSGKYASLRLLATAINGNQANQSFVVHYTDGTSKTFTQSISDWYISQGYSGESTALTMAYRNTSSGGRDTRTFHLYGYSLALDPTKTVQSITLPNNVNVEVLAMTLLSS